VETLLQRLVALNAKRAAEEAAGTVRWLRPEFQQRSAASQAAAGPRAARGGRGGALADGLTADGDGCE
jgi:hypothetical protein